MTKLKAKVTNALNETRMLILGAQILLGLSTQFRVSAALFWYGLEVTQRGRKGGTSVNRRDDDAAADCVLYKQR
jgi:chromosome condensin MukBEF MukE localization factor